jgi:hypothetical protein
VRFVKIIGPACRFLKGDKNNAQFRAKRVKEKLEQMQSVVHRQTRVYKVFARTGLLLAVFIFVGMATSLQSPASALAATGWQDTGFTLPDKLDKLNVCLDGTQPNVLLISNKFEDAWRTGTYTYNWVTGQKTLINTRPFDKCNQNNGLLYAANPNSQSAWLFSSRNPGGQLIQYMPSDFAQDGTLQVYSLLKDAATQSYRLYASHDGGRNWYESRQDFDGQLTNIAVNVADGRAIYALATEPGDSDVKYSIYFSVIRASTFLSIPQAATTRPLIPCC